MKYEFEKNFLDKGIMTLRFKINYWLLKKLGLNSFGLFAFIWGIFIGIIIASYFFTNQDLNINKNKFSKFDRSYFQTIRKIF